MKMFWHYPRAQWKNYFNNVLHSTYIPSHSLTGLEKEVLEFLYLQLNNSLVIPMDLYSVPENADIMILSNLMNRKSLLLAERNWTRIKKNNKKAILIRVKKDQQFENIELDTVKEKELIKKFNIEKIVDLEKLTVNQMIDQMNPYLKELYEQNES